LRYPLAFLDPQALREPALFEVFSVTRAGVLFFLCGERACELLYAPRDGALRALAHQVIEQDSGISYRSFLSQTHVAGRWNDTTLFGGRRAVTPPAVVVGADDVVHVVAWVAPHPEDEPIVQGASELGYASNGPGEWKDLLVTRRFEPVSAVIAMGGPDPRAHVVREPLRREHRIRLAPERQRRKSARHDRLLDSGRLSRGDAHVNRHLLRAARC
jgi:hypothetical protein